MKPSESQILSHEIFMGRALTLAKRAEEQGEVPVGAVLVYNQQIIGEGYNQPIATTDPTAHAEILALRQAAAKVGNYRLLNTTLYVTLEPCAMCAGAMIHARIHQCVFGAKDPRTGAVCSVLHLLDNPSVNHRINWQGDVLAEDAGSLLRHFFQKRRNKIG